MKLFSKTLLVNSIAVALFGGGTLQTALADTEVSTLPTIKVAAEKQQEEATFANGALKKNTQLGPLGNKQIIDTPFSINSYSEQLIENQQANTAGEVLKNDASVRTTTNQGHLNENFKIRGFDVNHEDLNYNGFYGVAPYGRMPTEFLESVSVLKGPNALVAGVAPTGSVGGIIIGHSKRADKELTRVSAAYEDGGYYQSGFDVSRRFGQEKEFGLRVNGAYADGEHIIDGMNDRQALGSIAADYTTDKVKINLDAYAVKGNRKGGSPAMVAMGGKGSVNQVHAAPKGDLNYFSDLKGNTNSQFVGLSGEYKFTPDLKAFAGIGYVEKSYDGHLFGTRMIVNNVNGNATSQYYRVGSKEHNTAANFGFEGKFDTGSIQHTLGLRADYLTRQYTQHKAATSSSFTTNLYHPSNTGKMPTTYPEIVPYGDNEYVSYTLTDQISMLDDKLQLILGARYQDIDTNNLVKKTSYNSDKLSPSLGVVIKPFGEDLSFYASYVEGLAEGVTVSEITYPTATNQGDTLAPYQTKQYELGAKYQWGSWLNTVALYQIEKPEVYQDTITNKVKDDAETRSRGIEWSFSGNVTDALSLMGSLAYIDAEYVKSGKTAIQGNNVYGVPDFTASLGLDYAIPQIDGLNINTRVSYVSEQYLNEENSLKLPDYTIVDLGARYKTKLGGVNTTFLANVDNVTNKKYWEGVFNSNYALVGGARTYKVGVTFDF
ncbi:TonB-dependent receptor [Acinetobacter bereziniae]|uniref:TonB-dependent receptor n=1 Tax=Acinetobacter bereziniae TaxID=106648 RepID=UPI0018DDE267|nr:TonB-dependent siderophore receptor [Acinetobacter bereziniae]MBI0396636.1 TonB-dependent siderophore receptor [Acinetobacter bereziniae]